jgi:hypothetical protein
MIFNYNRQRTGGEPGENYFPAFQIVTITGTSHYQAFSSFDERTNWLFHTKQ